MKKNEDVIAIYSRKSKFTGKGESIGNQVELCRNYIRQYYGDKAAETALVFEDEGFSGGNLNRPDFKRMMAQAQEKKFRAIIVYRLDRISRNISDFAGLIEQLAKLDIDFISIREQFDTATPMGRAMMYIASVFSQLERETIAERIRDNMLELAKTGRWLGGTTPTGFCSESITTVTVDGKTRKACKLKVIPEEAELIKQIFELFARTNSLTMTEAELMKRHTVSKNGKNFTRYTVKSILQNPVYATADEDSYRYFAEKDSDLFSDRSEFDGEHGIMAYNRTDQEKGRAAIFKPVSEWIVAVGKHPGLISGKEWVKVQDALEENRTKSFRRPKTNGALLTGLIYCRCGSRMYPKLSNRKTPDGVPVFSYVCNVKERSKRSLCSSRNANGTVLDAAVAEQIKKLSEDNAEFISQLENSRKLYTANHARCDEQLVSLKKEKLELQKKIDSLVDSLIELSDSKAKSHIANRIEALNQESDAIDIRIKELDALTSQQLLTGTEFDMFRHQLSSFQDSFDELPILQKRTAIRSLVRKAVWDGNNAHVILFGALWPQCEDSK